MTQVREEQNCFQQTKWFPGFLFWYKKTVMSKKIFFAGRNLKDGLPNLPLERGKEKKKIKVFLS